MASSLTSSREMYVKQAVRHANSISYCVIADRSRMILSEEIGYRIIMAPFNNMRLRYVKLNRLALGLNAKKDSDRRLTPGPNREDQDNAFN